jgi:hypothetical protein
VRSDADSLQKPTLILLALKSGVGCLRLFIHPNLNAVVHQNDIEYIDSLIQDLRERAQLHPEKLFTQISTLEIGPLLTRATGLKLSDVPEIMQQSVLFEEL